MKIHDDGQFLPSRGVRDGELGRPVIAERFLGPGVAQVPHLSTAARTLILDPSSFKFLFYGNESNVPIIPSMTSTKNKIGMK